MFITVRLKQLSACEMNYRVFLTIAKACLQLQFFLRVRVHHSVIVLTTKFVITVVTMNRCITIEGGGGRARGA